MHAGGLAGLFLLSLVADGQRAAPSTFGTGYH
jgi:hypothetical protein